MSAEFVRRYGCHSFLVILSAVLVLAAFPTPSFSQCGSEYQITIDCSACGGTINYQTCCVPIGCITLEVRNGNCEQSGLCSFLCGGMQHNTYYYCSRGNYSYNRLRAIQKLHGEDSFQVILAAYRPSGVDVQVNVPSTVPLQLLNVEVNPSPSGMSGMHYTLKNDSGQALVAVEIKWTISMTTGSPMLEVSDMDAWVKASGMLGPGAETTFQEGSLVNKQSNPVTGVTGTITYAEFADGSRVGPDANGVVYHRLREDRLALKMAYQQILTTYNTGGREALLSTIQGIPSSAETMAHRVARINLDQSLQKKGIDATVQNLQRVASLKVP